MIEVRDPATGRVVGSVACLDAEAVAALAMRARAAQPAWEAMGFDGRGAVLRRAAGWVAGHADEVARTIVAETGKAYEDALLAEVQYGASALRFWARHAPRWLAEERVRSGAPAVIGRKLRVRRRPLGLVGVIGPWNYPLTNTFGDAIPALAAGNAVLVKPSELTPLTSLLLARVLEEAGLPLGALAVATGGAGTGEAVVDAVDMVMFTGSTRAGRAVATRAAAMLKPVSLELGGKDPMIVLADADLERAANAAVYYGMQNAGQTCISVERVYVESSAHDDFAGRVAAKVRALRQGAPAGPGAVDVGALTAPAQLDIVAAHVDEARAAGARVLCGGHAGPGPGTFYAPTVLVDVDHSMRCMTEETFGPTLPIMRVRDAEEALALANDSPYGLSASVWSRDVARAEGLARRIEAGAVCVNDAAINYLALSLPMGGWKASGLCTRHGPDGIRKYTRTQSVLVTRLAPRREIHMFPYRAGTTRLLRRLTRLLAGR